MELNLQSCLECNVVTQCKVSLLLELVLKSLFWKSIKTLSTISRRHSARVRGSMASRMERVSHANLRSQQHCMDSQCCLGRPCLAHTITVSNSMHWLQGEEFLSIPRACNKTGLWDTVTPLGFMQSIKCTSIQLLNQNRR